MLVADRLPRLSDLPDTGCRVHLVGAAGAGMRALAAVLIDGGWRVSGSDRDADAVKSMSTIGLRQLSDTDSSAVADADVVIRSSAIPDDHPAISGARAADIPILKRASAVGCL